MGIEWHTSNINIQDYYKIIRRTIILNSSYKYWQYFKAHWDVHIFPVNKTVEFSHFYEHLDVETSIGIAWGVTGKHEMHIFINDTRNPFIIRSNAMPISHELLHAIYQDEVGTGHITRKYDSPEGRQGTQGAAATVIVHDNWYGRQKTLKFWIAWGLGWLPITISYMPVRIAKMIYKL